eukprot:7067768-Prymnesium_polylepis.1
MGVEGGVEVDAGGGGGLAIESHRPQDGDYRGGMQRERRLVTVEMDARRQVEGDAGRVEDSARVQREERT